MGRLERHLDDEAIARAKRTISDRERGIIHVPPERKRREHNPRAASTYRGARRNECLKTKPKSTWGPDWYYDPSAE